MDNQQVQQLEASIERNKADIAQLDALEHLFANKYFQELILNGYLKEEAVRLVMLTLISKSLNNRLRSFVTLMLLVLSRHLWRR